MADGTRCRKEAARYVISYVLWLLSAGLAAFELVVSLRVLSRVSYVVARNADIHSVLDHVTIFSLGVATLAFVVFCESHYQEGVEKNVLWRRFVTVIGVQMAIFVVLTSGAFRL